jgi:ribosomal protein L37AE/L43A
MDCYLRAAVGGMPFMIPRISFQRLCPSCRSGHVFKVRRRLYECHRCRTVFAGYRIGPVRIAFDAI